MSACRCADDWKFQIQGAGEIVQGIAHLHCRLVQRSDGYGYSRKATSKGDSGARTAAVRAIPSRRERQGFSRD